MRGGFVAVGLMLAMCSLSSARGANGRAVYCTQGANGVWSLHRFKPLIRAQGGTVFAEMWFTGGVLDEVKLRRFYKDSQLAFDYTFDASGKLVALRGTVQVKSAPPPGMEVGPGFELADWLGEADLMPGPDGKVPRHHVFYSREKDRIEKPDGAERYVGRFDEAPVYRDIQSVPCAAMTKQAETMNATQE